MRRLANGTHLAVRDRLGSFTGSLSLSGDYYSNPGVMTYVDGTAFTFGNQLSFLLLDGGANENYQLNTINGGPAAIPEPSTIAMFGIGAGVMGLVSIRRRRREQKQATTI